MQAWEQRGRHFGQHLARAAAAYAASGTATDRLREPREDDQVGLKPDALKSANDGAARGRTAAAPPFSANTDG